MKSAQIIEVEAEPSLYGSKCYTKSDNKVRELATVFFLW
jgi:hypothetical protein